MLIEMFSSQCSLDCSLLLICGISSQAVCNYDLIRHGEPETFH